MVIVSHSSKIAEGVCDLSRQMAADVELVPAGGVEDAGGAPRIGTSFEKVLTAISAADSGAGVVVLTDLGSAVMTAEMALEFLDSDQRGRVRLARAALVEGAVAAAVEAQTGADADQVVRAAEAAVVALDPVALEPFVSHAAAAPGEVQEGPAPGGEPVEGSWELPNPMGLHARPAATLARMMSELDAEVSVNGVDAKSVMLLMSLGLGQGKVLTASAAGPDAQKAIDQIGSEVTSGFGELAAG
nr:MULTISPECIES: dihydroxyacetone kinase phosphoryl donor subunit DhaM [unclassified Arthrobacter]